MTGYDAVFARQVEGARTDDVAVGITTSAGRPT
jgi:phosphoheptose isomerase